MRESFRAPFLKTAWQRHARIVDFMMRGDELELRSAASELHCLVGEASMLEFAGIVEIARNAEQAARDGNHEKLIALMGDLRIAIKHIESGGL